MIGIPSAEPPAVVLHDIDVARERLADAVEHADGTTRPGLELALSLLAELRISDDHLIVEWARRAIAEAGVDARTDEVAAIGALRTALPGMNLRAATALAGRVRSSA